MPAPNATQPNCSAPYVPPRASEILRLVESPPSPPAPAHPRVVQIATMTVAGKPIELARLDDGRVAFLRRSVERLVLNFEQEPLDDVASFEVVAPRGDVLEAWTPAETLWELIYHASNCGFGAWTTASGEPVDYRLGSEVVDELLAAMISLRLPK